MLLTLLATIEPFTFNVEVGAGTPPIPTFPDAITRIRSLPAPSLIEILFDPVAKVPPVLDPMMTLFEPVVTPEPAR